MGITCPKGVPQVNDWRRKEREKLTVNSPSQMPSMVPGLNVPKGLSSDGTSLLARRLHRSHSQSHSELIRTCGETEEGTRGDIG